MTIERREAGPGAEPFPIHADLVDTLLAAHAAGDATRDATVGHLLGTCAAYAYADVETVSTMMARLGLEGNASVRITQTIDAMFVQSTAYLVQSACGRVAILCYRGTEPTNLVNWMGDADVEPTSITLDGTPTGVHAGFYRNMRATRLAVLQELSLALSGSSLADPDRRLDRRLEALYLCGHSLGGAMAVLFALTIDSLPDQQAVAERVRAVYTYGQPMALTRRVHGTAERPTPPIVRHVLRRDVVPVLPPADWGSFAHVGAEYCWSGSAWTRNEAPCSQLRKSRDLANPIFAMLAGAKSRASALYALSDHAPHSYLAALRPAGRITELGDFE